jgi:energy-coupling factor transport system ATP-binding protein
LDEPTRGLDYSAKRALAKALQQLKGPDRTIILATHDIEFIAEVSDRVIRLESGKVVSDASPVTELAWPSPFASQIAQITRTPGLISIGQVIK